MGVTGLWTVVQPAARPIKIETLNKKRLAVDASIWIYQFLKAVRDKEGNALRNSHVVGFFRRICKLLFFGIKPVFVFDGGAPVLKRQTISGRKARREGRREDAVRTAGKLLALQMQRRAEEEEERRKAPQHAPAAPEEEELPENLVYVDELQMTQQERQQNRKFKKKDQYHLPDLDVPLSELGQPNDPRVMSLADLEHYAKQFNSGEDINVYDFSKIDFESQFFTSLPASDRYNILNAARLRSRLRMGMSKDQLDTMFPNRMDFSRFQVDRVRERNELTQRLMSINNNDEPWSIDGGGRVAGEKGREYVLVKNDGVEGGWALGVISDDTEGKRNKPIDVDEVDRKMKQDEADEEWEDQEDEFEDVPIEGLNRLPKLAKSSAAEQAARDTFKKSTAGFRARRNMAPKKAPAPKLTTQESDSLFVDHDFTVEDVEMAQEHQDTDDEELQRAIAMSLEANEEVAEPAQRMSSPEDDEFEEVFGQRATAPNAKSDTKFTPQKSILPFTEDSDDEQYDMEEEEMAKLPNLSSKTVASTDTKSAPFQAVAKPAFSGPLPFESLDLGSSLLGRKKMKQREEEAAGGFERDLNKRHDKKATGGPIPPWFSGDIAKDLDDQKAIEEQDRLKARQEDEQANFELVSRPQRLRQQDTNEVIDIDMLDEEEGQEVIDLDESDEEGVASKVPTPPLQQQIDIPIDDEVRMGDLADKVRAEPPRAPPGTAVQQRDPSTEPLNAESIAQVLPKARISPLPTTRTSSKSTPVSTKQKSGPFADDSADEQVSEDEALEWGASDHEEAVQQAAELSHPAGGAMNTIASASPSPEFEFENVDIPAPALAEIPKTKTPSPARSPSPLYQDGEDPNAEIDIIPATGVALNTFRIADDEDEDQADRDYYSDLSDEELLDQLATEAEEHTRFASQLGSHAAHRQTAEDFDRELKNLRSQQKKDRRDADEVTQQMILECQQLLSHFGLPYITAPMEAEAQCAELVHLRLVDGIVTDDSDIFLFGGTRVYKNMFNAAKFVECYLASDLEREFDLTRQKMIGIAHLLGSDYTEGLPGVGPVTALEILSEFPGGLREFQNWWTKVQTGAKAGDEDLASPFRKKFRKKAGKLFLPPIFPDLRVDQAYLEPEVDSDPSAFVWGVPDLDSLRSFLMATIGWTQERTDEVLVPVIKYMNRREKEGTQSNITQFLGGSVGVGAAVSASRNGDSAAFAPRRKDAGKSRRMEVALERLADVARERRREAAAKGKRVQDVGEVREEDEAEDAVVAIPGSAAAGTGSREAKVVSMTAAGLADAATKGKGKDKGRKRVAADSGDKPKKTRKRKTAPVDEDNEDEDVDNQDKDDSEPQQRARSKRKPRAKKATSSTAAGPRPKQKRRSKTTVTADDEDDEEGDDE